MNQINKYVKALCCLGFAGIALSLTGCATTETKDAPQPKAAYQEFTDATWRPETAVRAPYRTTELPTSTQEALSDGIYAFFETHRSHFQLQTQSDGKMTAIETIETAGERVLSWGSGADTLYRNARPLTNAGIMSASALPDGRVLLQNEGDAPFNMALNLRAFNIAGKPIRHFLRNNNNQPDELAWFMKENAVFPPGSVAYLSTYWLGDDEIVRPSKNAFTGADTLERLVRRFSNDTPFCLSYVSHTEAHPYGVIFKKTQHRSRRDQDAASGEFRLVPVKNASVFCEPITDEAQSQGTWKIVRIQGTRILELVPDAQVQCSDLGVQPVNDASTDIGFAEIITQTNKGERKNVVPVKILRNNQPIVDFRLKFNRTAADAIGKHLLSAWYAKQAHEADFGSHKLLSRPLDSLAKPKQH